MATDASYRVAFRRRREGKTDYQQRRSLVLSGLPRIVIRGSLRSMSVQLVKAEVGGDKVIASACSKDLAKNYGWQGGGGNLPAAYLTGLACGYKAAACGVKKTVLDLGLQAPTKGSRVFAALKGVLDAGIVVPHSKDKLPDEKRVQGQHIAGYAKQLSSTPEVYQKRFAEQLSKGLRPEEMAEHFAQVREKVSSALKKAEEKPEEAEAEEAEKPVTEEVKKKPPSRKAASEKSAKPKVRKKKKPVKVEEKE